MKITENIIEIACLLTKIQSHYLSNTKQVCKLLNCDIWQTNLVCEPVPSHSHHLVIGCSARSRVTSCWNIHASL